MIITIEREMGEKDKGRERDDKICVGRVGECVCEEINRE